MSTSLLLQYLLIAVCTGLALWRFLHYCRQLKKNSGCASCQQCATSCPSTQAKTTIRIHKN